jgi:type II secretory pathway component PulF
MSLAPRDKQQLYHSLAELLRAGITFPSAIDKLSRTAPRGARQALRRIRDELSAGHSAADACAAARPQIGAMEGAILSAVERAGKLDRGLDQLAAYFEAIAAARSAVKAKLAYPVFLLVFGILILNASKLITAGAHAYLVTTIGTLTVVLGAVLVVWLIAKALGNASVFSPLADGLVRAIPVIGIMHRSFAMARFCLTYELQLEAGVNTLAAVQSAAAASRSALAQRDVARAVEKVRAGSKVGETLEGSSGFDPAVVQGIVVGEETGQLDKELKRLAVEQQAIAMARLAAISEWLPRLIYISVLLYLGWTIVKLYDSYLKGVMSLMDPV